MIKNVLSASELSELLDQDSERLVVVLYLTNWCGSAVKVARNIAEVRQRIDRTLPP
jgi:hypothetical protein